LSFFKLVKSIPQFHQAISRLQHSYLEAWKKAIEFVISMNQDFATKSGMSKDVTSSMAKIVNGATEEIIKA
jgi:hypothetical protein